jgi:hypothetical protein
MFSLKKIAALAAVVAVCCLVCLPMQDANAGGRCNVAALNAFAAAPSNVSVNISRSVGIPAVAAAVPSYGFSQAVVQAAPVSAVSYQSVPTQTVVQAAPPVVQATPPIIIQQPPTTIQTTPPIIHQSPTIIQTTTPIFSSVGVFGSGFCGNGFCGSGSCSSGFGNAFGGNRNVAVVGRKQGQIKVSAKRF